MPLYAYKLVDSNGKLTKGTAEAATPERLKLIVQEPGTYVIDVKEADIFSKEISFSKVKTKDLSLFCEQLSSVLIAGVPISDGIKLVCNTTQNEKLKKTLEKVLARILSGIPLSAALGEYEDVFPLVMIQMVKAGEESGKQTEVFQRLAVQFKKQYEMKNQIKKALAYPKMILAVVAIAMVVVCGYIVPMFVDVFTDMGTEIPWSTKIFMAISELVTSKWYILLSVVVGGLVGWKLFKSSEFGENVIDKFKRTVPLFKNLTIKTASADFARTMSTLLSSGMDYPRALEISAETMSSKTYKEAVYQIHDDILNGAGLTAAVVKTELFPDLLTSLMSIGEETGDIPHMMTNAADYFEDEVQTATLQLTSALNPIIMIVMGVFVGLLVYSIYSPMFSMYNGIS